MITTEEWKDDKFHEDDFVLEIKLIISYILKQ